MEVTFVVGKICSGKDTYARNFPSTSPKIDIGDIVRELTLTKERTHNKDLDTAIIETVKKRLQVIAEEEWRAGLKAKWRVIITGVRQVSILDQLTCFIKFEIKWPVEYVYLDVPDHILEFRYLERQEGKDSKLTFQEAVERDNALGLGEVIDYVLKSGCARIKNYKPYEQGPIV